VDDAVDQDGFAAYGVEDKIIVYDEEAIAHHRQFFIIRNLSEIRMGSEMPKILFDSVC
jgi:hypothetical protein